MTSYKLTGSDFNKLISRSIDEEWANIYEMIRHNYNGTYQFSHQDGFGHIIFDSEKDLIWFLLQL